MLKAVAAAAALTSAAAPHLSSQTLPPCPVGTNVTAFNLIGANSNDTSFVIGPGSSAFETVAAPNGNPNLYQRNIPVVEIQCLKSGGLSSLSGILFGSRTGANNERVPVDLRSVPGSVIFSVWTNGTEGFKARFAQPDFEFNAGPTSNLFQRGSITNSANGVVFPTHEALGDLTAASQCFPVHAGDKIAIGVRIQFTSVSDVTVRLAQSANTNLTQNGTPVASILGAASIGSSAGTNNFNGTLPALSGTFTEAEPFDCRIKISSENPGVFRLSLTGSKGGLEFDKFVSIPEPNSPISEETDIPSTPEDREVALVPNDGLRRYFRPKFR